VSAIKESSLGAEFQAICEQFDLPEASTRFVEVVGEENPLGSPLRVTDAGVLTLAVQAAAAAALDAEAGRSPQAARIHREEIPASLRPFTYQTRNGESSGAWSAQIGAAPCSGHMQAADGRYVYMANVAPRLRDGTLRLLGAEPTRESVEAAVLGWESFALEEAMNQSGLPLTVVRSAEEWAASEQGAVMQFQPLAQVVSMSETAPEQLPTGARALAGVRVLDLTHVVAGPTVTRGLAEYGADILHIGAHQADLQDPVAVTDELMIGKRSARLDMGTESGRAEAERLVREADVVVHSWRPGVMERWGLGAHRLEELRPGIISLGISCFGPSGPWATRPGFDGNALAAVGVTDAEAQAGTMRLTPPGVVTDSLVGFAGAAAVMGMLRARARSGGGRAGHLSLAGMAMWLLELGLRDLEPAVPPVPPRMRRATAEDGVLLSFVEFPIEYAQRPARLTVGHPVLGGSAATWRG